jgi:hypothetical protein
MNDELEIRLRSAFRREGLPAAPATLLEALDAVVAEPVRPGSRTRGAGARRPWGVLAVAAVLLVGGAVALSVGSRTPEPAPSPRPTVSPAPSVAGGTRSIYEPQWTTETPFDVDELAAIVTIAQARIDATGAAGVVVSSDDAARVVVDIPVGVDPDPIRSLVGTTGLTAFVSVGATVPDVGATIDPARFPLLFTGSAVVETSVVSGEAGAAGLDLTLNEEAAALFADYSASHVGGTFAVTLDGAVVAVPAVQAAIPNGLVHIEFGGDREMTASDLEALAAVIQNGPLPVPLVEVSSGPAPSAVPTTRPTPSTEATAAPAIQCEPPLDVEGPQLDCHDAIDAALAILPADHPAIATVTFVHDCNDVRFQTNPDCYVQAVGVVTVTFVDGSPRVRIGLSLGSAPSIIPPLPTPSG